MRITRTEPVTRTYCDNCGKETKAGRTSYMVDGRDLGECCGHIFHEKVRRNRIKHSIEKQPFFV